MNSQAHTQLGESEVHLAADILKGASEIARFLFGPEAERRQIYNLTEAGALPTFRLGRIICARRSTLQTWIGRQEAGSDSHDRGPV